MENSYWRYIERMDAAGLRELMDTYGQDVWNLAYVITRRHDLADDVTQDVFLKVYQTIGSFRGASSIRTWLLAMTRNTAINYKRTAFMRRVLLAGRSASHDGESQKQDGYLKDALPFATDEVKKIWVKETLIPQDRMYVILQNLNGLEMTKAASADKTLSEESLIRFETADSAYRIPYDVNTNEYLLGGRRYYADDQVMLLMHGILQPNSKLAQLDRMFEQARLEMESHEGGIDESFSYSGERLTVADKSYNEWEQLLLLRSSVQPTLIGHYYDDAVQKVGSITEYSDGVIQLNRSIVFLDGNHTTSDGLAVGMSKEEVLQKLGKPNLQLESKWSYKIGDYLKFHLYFDHNKIRYIVLSQPL